VPWRTRAARVRGESRTLEAGTKTQRSRIYDWDDQLAERGADQVLDGNLSSAFYCVLAGRPIVRARRGGVLIQPASIAGRSNGPLSGGA